MGRSWWLGFFLLYSAGCTGKYQIHNVRFEVFSPRGFRASIPDTKNLTLFVFQGSVIGKLDQNEVVRLSGDILEPTDGRWVFEDKNLELKPDDVINYNAFVLINGFGYTKDNVNYTIRETDIKPIPVIESKPPPPPVTEVPPAPKLLEYPFVSYQRRLTEFPTVSVKDGLLRIKPYLQQKLPGFTEDDIHEGTLNLFSSCTGSYELCRFTASGADILPPVVSGRISTQQSFSFKYGTVEVRAKLPQGDWIYPEILLEPLRKKYSNIKFASGVLKIASARGNKDLTAGRRTYGNELLYGGPVIHQQCNEDLLSKNERPNGRWGDEFHVYTVRWAPELITLTVDGEEWGRIEPAVSGLAGRLRQSCTDVPRDLWANGAKMAPFDQEFYITLGVAVGGITEFLDGVQTTGGKPKPWVNSATKAKLRFWEDQAAWSETWTEDAELVVDYVRVTAL